MDKESVISDIQRCIENIESVPIHDPKYEESVGLLRRALVNIEGLENIWTEGMTDFQKGCVMKARGFKIRPVSGYSNTSGCGVVVSYLGYHLWGLTKTEFDILIKE